MCFKFDEILSWHVFPKSNTMSATWYSDNLYTLNTSSNLAKVTKLTEMCILYFCDTLECELYEHLLLLFNLYDYNYYQALPKYTIAGDLDLFSRSKNPHLNKKSKCSYYSH